MPSTQATGSADASLAHFDIRWYRVATARMTALAVRDAFRAESRAWCALAINIGTGSQTRADGMIETLVPFDVRNNVRHRMEASMRGGRTNIYRSNAKLFDPKWLQNFCQGVGNPCEYGD
jgi:hypothetical protein